MNINCCPICNTEAEKVLENDYFPLHLPPREKKVENNEKKLQKLSIYRCRKCDFIFNELKSENFYFNLYSDQPEYVVNKTHTHWLKIIKQNKYKSILDVGGGANSIYDLKGIKSKVSIVDYKVNPSYKNKNDLIFFEGSIEQFLFEKEYYSYEAVFLSHLLEHISNPKDYIKNLISHKSIKDADFLIEIPNIDFYSRFAPHYTFFFEHCSLLSPINIFKIMKELDYKLSFLENNGQAAYMLVFKKIGPNIEFSKKDFAKGSEILKQYKFNLEKLLANFIKYTEINHGKKINLLSAGGGSANLFLYYLNKKDKKYTNLINPVDKYRKGQYIGSINKLIKGSPDKNLKSYFLSPNTKNGISILGS